MQTFTGILVVVYMFLCLTFNCTFPLRRQSLNPFGIIANEKQICEDSGHKPTKHRFGKSAKITKNAKQPTQENIQNDMKGNSARDKNINLQQYEQMIIMKKYPYLDIKELEMKYRPSVKNSRHSLSYDPAPEIENEPSICDQGQELLNVEISNRGLSGFAIPKPTKQNLDKLNSKDNALTQSNIDSQIKTADANTLESILKELTSTKSKI